MIYISNPPSKKSSTLVLLSVTFIPPTVITGGFTGKPIRIYPKHKKTNNNANTARENIALFKSYLRVKLKLRDKTKDDISKKIEFGKLKKEIEETKSVEDFIKVYNSFKYLF